MSDESKNPVGRPLKFKTPEELEAAIDAYFDACDRANVEELVKPYTMSGLAIAMGIDRTTLCNYAHRDEFFNTIKKARAKVEEFAERQLYRSGQVAGTIFSLKNNFNWKDKKEIEHEGKVFNFHYTTPDDDSPTEG